MVMVLIKKKKLPYATIDIDIDLFKLICHVDYLNTTYNKLNSKPDLMTLKINPKYGIMFLDVIEII
jgi:hypothetical protein